MSTVLLTLVVVGGSIAVAARLAVSGERKPATEVPVPHRARRRRMARARRATGASPSSPSATDGVPARPGLLVRLRASLALVAVMVGIGAAIALGLVAGAEVVSRALETAVQ